MSRYGYKSLEEFVAAATQLRANPELDPTVFDKSLATLNGCALVTAILEAGRVSLDKKCPIFIHYNDKGTETFE